MKVLGCTAVAVIRAEIIVGRLQPEGKQLGVFETQSGTGNFSIWVPRRLEREINVGDTLVVLCMPSKKLAHASETGLVAKKEGNKTAVIWRQSPLWSEMYILTFT